MIFTLILNKFTRECYDFVNGEQHKTSIKDCFVHTDYRHLLCCHLGVAPSQANISRVLVLGSAGKIGLSFTKKLKEKKIQFVEIRGRLHFDLSNDQIYEIFDTLSISHVYDLVRNENESIHEKIFSYFNSKKIIVTRVVENQIDSKYDQIISPPAFGNQYMRIDVSQLFNDTFYCIVENKCIRSQSNNLNTLYTPSNEISIELLNTLQHQKPQIIKKDFNKFNEQQIWEKVLLYKQNKLEKSDSLFYELDEIYKSSLERSKKPYLSISYLTTNDILHYSRSFNTLKIYNMILTQFPDISLEVIFFWVKQYNDTSFFDVFQLNSKLKFQLRVIEVSKKSEQLLMNVLQTEKIPEYFYRDIGVRLGVGDLLFSGSSDVYPSPAFFEMVQRKLVGPFTILKSIRFGALPSVEESFSSYFKKQENIDSGIDNVQSPCDFSYYYVHSHGEFGDLQGTLRDTMYALNGWVFNKFTWAVDTAFFWDFEMFKVPFHFVVLNNSMHQSHPIFSVFSPHFVINRRDKKTNMLNCNGIPTKNRGYSMRPNWGISFDFMAKSDAESNGKYGHLVYKITQIKKENLEYTLFDLVFNVIYNN